jgi:four helix bundle protein
MSEYKNLPVWKKGMTFAHTVYAAVEVAGVKGSDAGKRLRKAAVSVPSLVGEAFLDLSGKDVDEALALADSRLAEVARLLGEDPALASIGDAERADLLDDILSLRADIETLKLERGNEKAN